MEKEIQWELVNPEGVVVTKEFRVNPHPETLEGKNVMLRWNGKHNGDVFLNRMAEYLAENVNDVQIFKSWEVAPETATTSESPNMSKDFTEKLAAVKPDIVIGLQGD